MKLRDKLRIYILGTAWTAHSSDAFLVGQTFAGAGTGGRRVATSDFGIADQSVEAAALGSVVGSQAFCVGTASGRRCADGDALGVETGVSHGTIGIGPAANFAHSHRADLSAGTVGILTTDGHAHPLAASLIDQTLGVGRAEWPANRVLTSESSSAALGSGARRRLADAGRVGSRVGQETGRAGALSSLIHHITQSVGSCEPQKCHH